MYTVGDVVSAIRAIRDGRYLVARPGDYGRVEYVAPDGVPTVRWDSTGRAVDCDDCEIEVAHA